MAATIMTQASGNYSSSSVWPYTLRTGYISSSVSSKTITGTSTNFINEFNIGSYISNTSGIIIGKVKSITSSTSLELEENALSDNSVISYGIKGSGRIDQIQVKAGTSLTIDLRITCSGLSLATGASVNTILIIDSAVTITGMLNLTGPTTASYYNKVILNNTTLTCNSIALSANSSSDPKYDSLILNNSSVIIAGSLTSASNIYNIVKLNNTSLLSVAGTMGNVAMINNSTSSTLKLSLNGTVPNATYQNLILGGTSTISIASSVIVNGILTIENNPTLTGNTINYGSNATLKYNTTYTKDVKSIEWPTPLNASQVIISNTGTIKLNGNKSIKSLTIDEGSTLDLLSYSLDLSGDFNNSGSLMYTSGLNVSLTGETQNYTDNSTDTITFNTISMSGGTKNIAQNIKINGTLTLNTDANLQIASGKLLDLNCTINGTGTVSGGSCGNLSESSILFSKVGTYNPIYFHPTNNLFKNINISSNCNVTLGSDVAIYGTLNIANTDVTVKNGLTFHTSNTPITSSGGKLNMESTSSLYLGGCSTTGGPLNINSSLFSTNPLKLTNLSIYLTNGLNIVDIPVEITGVLDLNTGTLNTNNLLTLKSSSSGTARVSTIPTSNTNPINGSITVERYIPGGQGKRKWRLLSSPVNNNGSIALSEFIDDIYVTAPASSAGGFDPSPSNNASIRTYTESSIGTANIGWQDPTHISNTISTAKGLEVFVRGSRSLANPFLNWTVPDDVTIDYTGTLNKGTYFLELSYTNTNNTGDGFNLIGNPYPSPINFDTLSLVKVRIDNKFWSYDPNTGLYGLYDADLNIGTNGITPYIASGQGFFVKANAANPGIIFYENTKCIQPGNSYFKPSSGESSFIKLGVVNDSLYKDEVVIVFNSASTDSARDKYDAYKLFNDALNIFSVSKGNTSLCMDARPFINGIDTILLALYSYNGSDIMTTSHQIKLNEIVNIPNTIDIILWDKYLNNYQNLKLEKTYTFSINSDSSSWGRNRFALFVKDVNLSMPTEPQKNISIYPNPSSGLLHIILHTNPTDEHITYHVYDLTGKKVQSDSIETVSKEFRINLSDLETGLYWIEIISRGGTVKKKIIKQ